MFSMTTAHEVYVATTTAIIIITVLLISLH